MLHVHSVSVETGRLFSTLQVKVFVTACRCWVFDFRIIYGIDLPMLTERFLAGSLFIFDRIAPHSCYTSVMWYPHSTTSQRCSFGLRSWMTVEVTGGQVRVVIQWTHYHVMMLSLCGVQSVPREYPPWSDWTTHTRKDGSMFSCRLYEILKLPSECRSRNQDSSHQAMFI